MSVFALPALIALLSKVWVYILAKNVLTKKADYASQTFLCLLIFFAVNNLSEFLVISELFNNIVSENLLRSYYVALLFSLAFMCIFAMSVANQSSHIMFNTVALSVAVLMALVTFQTDLIIAGAVSIGYAITAVKGDYYFLFQLVVLLGFASIFYILVRRYATTIDINVQLKCFYAGFALSPIIIVSLIVMIMMQANFQYTGAILIPFASTFFLLLVVLTEKNNNLINIQGGLPFSAQRKAEKKLVSIYRSHVVGDTKLPETKSEIERMLIQSALDRAGDNVSLTANNLGIKRSTLYSIFNRLEMRGHGQGD